jgi:hypothetical protein
MKKQQEGGEGWGECGVTTSGGCGGDTRTLVVSTYHTICRGASHIMKQPRWKKYCFAAVYSSVPDGDTFEQGVFLVIYLPQWTFVLIFQAIVFLNKKQKENNSVSGMLGNEQSISTGQPVNGEASNFNVLSMIGKKFNKFRWRA